MIENLSYTFINIMILFINLSATTYYYYFFNQPDLFRLSQVFICSQCHLAFYTGLLESFYIEGI